MEKYQPTRVPTEKIRPLVAELILRCGTAQEAARYSGLAHSAIGRIMAIHNERVNAKTARVVILALYQRRKEDRLNGSSERFHQAIKRQAELDERIMRLTGY